LDFWHESICLDKLCNNYFSKYFFGYYHVKKYIDANNDFTGLLIILASFLVGVIIGFASVACTMIFLNMAQDISQIKHTVTEKNRLMIKLNIFFMFCKSKF